jgi:protein-ribulosamine 3-kinase
VKVPQQVRLYLSENGYGEPLSSQSVGGGCINNGARLDTSVGVRFFLKTNQNAPVDMFAREAEGLQALQIPQGPRVPAVYLCGEQFILLEDLAPAGRIRDYWQVFGRQLAALHNHTGLLYGFDKDNYIGSTPQPNKWMEDGYRFFAEQRLIYQARLAYSRGLLGISDVEQVEHLAAHLAQLIPDQPPSLIHGDLWSGNATSDKDGNPAIIDPAAHYGWAEAELAMTALFGAFPDEFYRAYQEVRSLEGDYRGRFPIYNLYHLLNHLNLFGSGYLGQVLGILRRYKR